MERNTKRYILRTLRNIQNDISQADTDFADEDLLNVHMGLTFVATRAHALARFVRFLKEAKEETEAETQN